MSDSGIEHTDSSSPAPSPELKKRKRSAVPPEEELEIDITQPEPPSKKTKRKEKKLKLKGSSDTPATEGAEVTEDAQLKAQANALLGKSKIPASEKRSEYGVWIGNLPWTANKEILRRFFVETGMIDDVNITRLHMPPPEEKKGPKTQAPKPQNKGFAYVDFSTPEDLEKAITLSEKLVGGRKVLIKNAKSFEGRPQVSKEEAEAKKAPNAKEPTKRVFVGNLGFDITQEDLEEHFAQAGELQDVHMATFQDTGKCKGFAWVRYTTIEAAEAAVKGFVYKDMNKEEDDDDDVKEEEEEEANDSSSSSDEGAKSGSKKKKRKEKKRKWFINRLHGRPLRCEFAEDAQTRYNKRFGKDSKKRSEGGEGNGEGSREAYPDRRAKNFFTKDERQDARRQRHQDARNVAPGQALANAHRATGAIVAAAGKKTKFD